ncbi:membrane-associated protein, putative [Bodo saltans]|uniref:Membrane-associated protein, putative n=1 Tax=Bodo saltans TaxID=75058 RepID=A0A0S4J3Q6_BODSA|nr:membrane-associated protein, putative [Bodo saltans]|eukprot:CUG69490.1 membrane-associated protein, putative [Bodo saltans]
MQLAIYLFCLFFFTLALPTAVVADEVACDVDNHTLVSHSTYTITNCARRDGSPFLLLVPGNDSSTLLNVSVVVTFGTVLPMLLLDSMTLVENVAVLVSGARVSSVSEPPLVQLSASSMSMVFVNGHSFSSVRGVALAVVNVTVTMDTESRYTNFGSIGACLLLVVNMEDHGIVDGIRVLVEESTVLQRFNSTTYRSLGMMDISVGEECTIRNVNVTIASSAIQVFANFSSQAYFWFPSTALVLIQTTTGGPSGSIATDVYYATIGKVLLQIEMNTVGTALGAMSGTAAYALASVVVLGVHNVLAAGVNITLSPGARVVAVCECSRLCGNQNIDAPVGILSTYVVSFRSFLDRSSNENVTIALSGVTLTAKAPSGAYLISVYLTTTHRCIISLADLTFDSSLRGFYIGTEARSTSVVYFANVAMSEVTIALSNVSLASTVESGGCSSTISAVVSTAGNVSNSSFEITEAHLSTFVTVGVVTPLSLFGVSATLSAASTNLLSLLPPSLLLPSTVEAITIRIVNSAVVAGHTSGVPLLTIFTVVISSISAVSLITSVRSSNILIQRVVVQRTRPLAAGAETWFPRTYTGGAINVTSIVTALDISGLMYVFLPGSSSFVSSMIGPATVTTQTNVSVRISECNVSYATNLAPGLADVPAFFFAPSSLTASNYTIHNSSLLRQPDSTTSRNVVVSPLVSGAFMAVLSNTTVDSTTISFSNSVSLSAVLLLVKFSSLRIAWKRTYVDAAPPAMRFIFTRVTTMTAVAQALLFSVTYGGSIHFVANSTSAATSLSSSLSAPLISVTQSTFENYRFVFAPNHTVLEGNLNSSNDNHQPAMVLLELGCTNLWNREPMSLAVAAEPRSPLLAYTAFPQIGSIHFPDCQPARLPLRDFSVSAGAAGSVAAVVYVSLLSRGSSAVTRGAATSLQRSMQVLRLWQRCRRSADDDSPFSEDGANSSPPLFSDLSDNVLGISFTFVDDEIFDFAAGAAFGNAIFVVALGALFHLLLVAKARVCQSLENSPIVSFIMDMTPAARLPGSIANDFGKLLQPSTAACTALLFGRSISHRVCGAVLACVWLYYPVASAHAVLWRGRRDRQFLLVGARVRSLRQTNDSGSVTTKQHLTKLVTFTASPTQEWKPRPGCSHRGTKERHYSQYLLSNLSPVFEAFVERREWYFMVEWTMGILSGIVLGAASVIAATGGDEACSAAQWGTYSAIAFSVLNLVFCLLLRPFSVRLEIWMTIVISALELLAEVLVAAGDADASDSVVTTSATLELVVIAVVTLFLAYYHNTPSLENAPVADGPKVTIKVKVPGAIERLRARATQVTTVAAEVTPPSTATTKTTSLEQLRSLIELICSQQAAESNTPSV